MGSLDLSALDDDTPSIISDGKALRAPLEMFIPDPEQLARERDEEADNRDREDIRQRGVMQPIVASAPHPDGRMDILIGHRRWRLSGEAGIADVPYVHAVEGVVYDEYAKLAENRKRKNESPMDIAKLIVKRKAKGEKNKFIADQIGIDPSEITHHLVLIEGPDFIRALYDNQKCRTPKYLYELTNLAKEYPREVQEFCEDSDDFSYKGIKAFGDSLKGLGNTKESAPPPPPAAPQVETPAATPAGDDSAGDDSDGVDNAAGSSIAQDNGGEVTWPFPTGSQGLTDAEPTTDENAPAKGDEPVRTQHIPSHNPDNEKDAAAPNLADTSKIKKPLLLGTYKGSDVMVMLYKRPTTQGLVFIKHENGTGEEEVEFGKIKNLTLTESKQ